MKTIPKLSILLIAVMLIACNKQVDKKGTATKSVSTEQTKASVKTVQTKATNDSIVNPIQSLADIYNSCEKPAQSFTFAPNEDKTIICKEGTKITIHANSLVYEETSKTVSDKVTLKVTEYYKISDIILARLSTSSDGKPLETGGMIKLEAYAKGKKLKLKEGEITEIAFPYKKKKEGMQLFNGFWDKNGINWKVEPKNDVDAVYTLVEQPAQYPGGMAALYDFLNKNIVYPADARESGIQGQVICQFIVDISGVIKNVVVVKSVDPSLDAEAIRVIKKIPKWIPAEQGGKKVNLKRFLPINFILDDESSTTFVPSKEFYKNVDSKNNGNVAISDIRKYIFSTSKLGWINCDLFWTRKVSEFTVNISQTKQINMSIVFNNISSFLSGSINGNKYIFTKVPVGEPITIVAVKQENNKSYLALTKTTTDDKNPQLNYKQVNMAELKNAMESLNKK